MDEEQPKQSRGKWTGWMSATVFAFVLLVAYQAAYYATTDIVTTVGPGGVCRLWRVHTIRGKPVPQWVEHQFFRPAERIDELLRDWLLRRR